MSMPNTLQVIKNEILDADFIKGCKDLVEKICPQTTIVLVCNCKQAKRHLMTVSSQMMHGESWRQDVSHIARHVQADAILTVTTSASTVESQRCMEIAVETLFDRYGMVYPYEMNGYEGFHYNIDWEEPREVELPNYYGDLLPVPAGTAKA